MSTFGHAGTIAEKFALPGPVTDVTAVSLGHINDSYRVGVRRESGEREAYFLQRLNPGVFPDGVRVMENIVRVTRHIERHRAARRTQLQGLSLTATTLGRSWFTDSAGACWRMFDFVGGAHSLERPDDPGPVREAARAYGEFLHLIADLPAPSLHETIPGFHDTPARLARFEDAARGDRAQRAASAREEIAAVHAQAGLADLLPPLLAGGAVPRRIVHNDAKLSNVLLDDVTGRARGVVDLDTVMPGTPLSDFGDMVRSMTSPTAEDEEDLAAVGVRLPLFEAVAQGFLEGAGPVLTAVERRHLVHAGLLITFEQAVRFLTDHLEGDRYYRIARPGHNLARARTQLRLLASLTTQRDALEAIVARAGG